MIKILTKFFCKSLTNQLKISELTQKIFQKIELKNKEYKQMLQLLDKQYSYDLSKKLVKMEKYSNLLLQYKQKFNNLIDLTQLENIQSNKTTLKQIKKQKQQIYQNIQQITDKSIKQLIPSFIYDQSFSITLQFSPGVGGDQSQIFTKQLCLMYQNYFQFKGWECNAKKIVQENSGYKYAILNVEGQNCFKIMKCQSGIHKVIRVPQTQKKGRLHSSTSSIVVMPNIPFQFSLNQKDLRFQYMRSSGPGGQHVNKTQSACRVIHQPTGLYVMNQQTRSQQNNRRRAIQVILIYKILKQKLFALQYNKEMDKQSKTRKFQIGTKDRCQKIRTYNYPQNRITDHRCQLTKFGIQQMMKGKYIQEFTQLLLKKQQQELIKGLLQQINI